MAKRFKEQKQIETIQHLKSLKNTQNLPLYKVSGISMKKFKELIEMSQVSNTGSRPQPTVIDHTKAENPYLSLYREEKWEEKINET